jgi:AraC-like DNA-binding protein
MTDYALTRISTIGPIADLIEAHGGSAARVFARAGLPETMLERPDGLMLMRDQVGLLEEAAREIGDETFPARIAGAAGLWGLGAYGRHFQSFGTLGAAISIAYRDYAQLMQGGTRMVLDFDRGRARWCYQQTTCLGAHAWQNEILAMGYILAGMRAFAGAGWRPDHVTLPARVRGHARLAAVFDCDVRRDAEVAIVFRADMLDLVNPSAPRAAMGPVAPVPASGDLRGVIAEMIRLEVLGGRPGIGPVAERLGLARRTLQRRLSERGASFQGLQEEVRCAQARQALAAGGMPITEIALSLGYADSAHFTRAFRRWTGYAPREWRRQALAGMVW